MSAAPFLILVVGAALAGAVVYLQYQRDQQRRAELAAFAASKGWAFDPVDRVGLAARWVDPPFGIGHSRRVSNVLSGTERGREMLAFDYRYKVTTSNGKSTSTQTYTYGVCVLALPAYLPPLEVGPENLLTRFGGALGFADIELESEDFNRAYRVRGAAKLAHDVLSPRTMELLLHRGCTSWRIAGPDILGWDDGRQSPAEILERLSTLSAVVDGIPSFVWTDYGPDAATG